MKRRPLQYLGLALLVLASLAIIFLPVSSRPEPQAFSIRVQAPKPFTELVAKGKNPTDVVDEAFAKGFKENETIPGAFNISTETPTLATIEDKAATQAEAQTRANRIVQTLSGAFKGVKLAPDFSVANLPQKPIFTLGNSAVYPPRERNGSAIPAVKLGLDLQGGVNLVLQVRRALFPYRVATAPTNDAERNAILSRVRTALSSTNSDLGLRSADLSFNAQATDQIQIRTQARDRAQFDAQKTALDALMKTLNLAPASAPQFYQPQEDAGQQLGFSGADYSKQLLERTVAIIGNRVDRLGVSEPLIQAQYPDRVIVQLPGVNDPERAVEVIGQTAQMEIRLLPQELTPRPDPNDPNNTLFVDAQGNVVDSPTVRERSELIVSGADVKPNTTAGLQEGGEPAIFFELQGAGSQRFADVTRRVARQNRYIPIFLDDKAISAPTVQSPITGGKGQISGGFASLEEARELAVLLNSGALPAPIDVVENRTVSATLGNDSLIKSLRAGAIGLALVAIFMLVFYRLPGAIANCALVIYTLLNLAVFVLIGGTLTLPGIAGFLLALAMSLDTNILVFERLKEEMAIQPTFTAALRAAFSRAWTAILDSHITTLIAATVLFYFGTGPVKGFALTLGIGVILSLFSAISVTRLFMWSAAGVGERNKGMFAPKVSTKGTAAQRA
jgi:protein-export membrane protein SecD